MRRGRTVRRAMQVSAVPIVLLAAFAASPAGAATYSNPAPITVPGGNPALPGPASPYPSAINVAGVPGTVADVNVTIKNISHTCFSDVDYLLVGPGGQKSLLLSRAGGYCDDPAVGVTVTLDDEAATTYPCKTSPSGAFKPTDAPQTPAPENDCEQDDVVFPAPAPPAPYLVALSSQDGGVPNGTWNLFVNDVFNNDSGVVAGGWSLDLAAGSCAKLPATLSANVGTAGPDLLTGTPGPDTMLGLGGNDRILGLAGNDVICGGLGNDKILSGPGKDLLRGEGGRDKLKGQGGKDTCVGGAKPDSAKTCEKQKSI
jgi:subtilisin-like proprotein convertase family protein